LTRLSDQSGQSSNNPINPMLPTDPSGLNGFHRSAPLRLKKRTDIKIFIKKNKKITKKIKKNT